MPTSQAANKHTPGNAAPSGIHQPRQQLLWMGGSGGQKGAADESRTGLWAQGSRLLSPVRSPLPSSAMVVQAPGRGGGVSSSPVSSGDAELLPEER